MMSIYRIDSAVVCVSIIAQILTRALFQQGKATSRNWIDSLVSLLSTVWRVIFVGQNIRVFVVGGLTTNNLPTNEATLSTFICSAS